MYGSAYVDRRIASTRKKERIIFSETLPKDNWYWVDVRKDMRLYDDNIESEEKNEEDRGPPTTWLMASTEFESRTDVSIYYNEGVSW